MKKILFVCTGNICRSPSAEAVFRHAVIKRGLEDSYIIDSVGTHGYHIGDAPDDRAIEAAKSRGVSMVGLKARKISEQDFFDFDEVIAMDEGHYNILENIKPANANTRLSLFMDYVEKYKERDVPDPYYGEASGFDHVLDLLEDGVQGMLKQV